MFARRPFRRARSHQEVLATHVLEIPRESLHSDGGGAKRVGRDVEEGRVLGGADDGQVERSVGRMRVRPRVPIERKASRETLSRRQRVGEENLLRVLEAHRLPLQLSVHDLFPGKSAIHGDLEQLVQEVILEDQRHRVARRARVAHDRQAPSSLVAVEHERAEARDSTLVLEDFQVAIFGQVPAQRVHAHGAEGEELWDHE